MIPLGAAFRERFEVLRTLGEGAMGIVLHARDRQLGREVAVKITKSLREDQLERFLREGRVLAALRHPGIVQVYDLGVDEGRPYLVCELSTGTTLEAVVRSGMPLPRILGILRSMAEALSQAHDQGIVHRDLKPENVQLVGDTTVKILDFGLALPVDMVGALTEPGLVLGTPAYMSPEQVTSGELRGTTDQFSLGVVAFEMVTGTFPFAGNTVMETASARLTDSPPAPSTLVPTVPPEIDAIILRLLARDPASRYPSMRELVEAIDAFELDPASAPAATAQAHIVTPPARSRGLTLSRSNVTQVTRPAGRSQSLRVSTATRSLTTLESPASRAPPARWAATASLAMVAGAVLFLVRPAPPPAPREVASAPPSPSAAPSRLTAQQAQLLHDIRQIRTRIHECRRELGLDKKATRDDQEDAIEARVVALIARFGPCLRRARAAFEGPSWLVFEAEFRPMLETCGKIQDRVDALGGPIWGRIQALSVEMIEASPEDKSGDDDFRRYALRILALSTDKMIESSMNHYLLQRWTGFEELAAEHPAWAASPAGQLERLRAASLVAHRERLPEAATSRAVTSLTETFPAVFEAGKQEDPPTREWQRTMLQTFVSMSHLVQPGRREPEALRAPILPLATSLAEKVVDVPRWIADWIDEIPPHEVAWAFERIARALGPGETAARFRVARKELESRPQL